MSQQDEFAGLDVVFFVVSREVFSRIFDEVETNVVLSPACRVEWRANDVNKDQNVGEYETDYSNDGKPAVKWINVREEQEHECHDHDRAGQDGG